MIFLDTNVWIDLLAVEAPDNEIKTIRTRQASEVLKLAQEQKEPVITCREQLLEVITAVQKTKMSAYNKKRKQEGKARVNYIKDYRCKDAFQEAARLCRSVYYDMRSLAELKDDFSYNLDEIMDSLEKADINDLIYLQYCKKNQVRLYTFDRDLEQADADSHTVTFFDGHIPRGNEEHLKK